MTQNLYVIKRKLNILQLVTRPPKLVQMLNSERIRKGGGLWLGNDIVRRDWVRNAS
jgi:hypothetical protein